MNLSKLVVIYDDTIRPDTTGGYCYSALRCLVQVEHFLPQDVARIPRQGVDLYLSIDDGLEYELPDDLRPLAWWAIDTHLGMERCLRRAHKADIAFTAQRDGAAEFRRQGVASAEWLPLACDPDIHGKHELDKQYDLCFIGNMFDGPRRQLIELLKRHYPNMLVDRRFFQEMARAYSASRLVFNRSILNDINMRVLEALCAGSLLVTNDLKDNGQEELFRDGIHLATFKSEEELLDKVRFYLHHEDIREHTGATGRKEVLARHTYRHRMEALLRTAEATLQKVSVSSSSSATAGAADKSLDDFAEGANRVLLIGTRVDELATMAADVKAKRQATVTAIIHQPTGKSVSLDGCDECFVGDLESIELPFAPQTFDAVWIDGVLERLRDPLNWLKRVHAWLHPESAFQMRVANARQHRLLQALIEGSWQGALPYVLDSGQLQFFTLSDLERLCFRAGFVLSNHDCLPGPDHDAWQRQGKLDEVNAGPLSISALSPDDARQFYSAGLVLHGRTVPIEDRGTTSIILLTHNELPFTQQCLESIRRLTDTPYELIVVDNASTDGTVAYLRSQPDIKLIENDTNRGFPAGANQGILAATGKQVLLLNNDTIVATRWLQRMLAALDRDPRIGLVGPVSNRVSGEQQVAVSYEDLAQLDHFAWQWGKSHDGVMVPTDRLVGFCLLIRRELIDAIGLLDERFGQGCFEDDDYCRRALDAGYRAVIAQDAFVHHFGGRTFIGSRVNFAELMAHNQRLYEEKWSASPKPLRQEPTQEIPQPMGTACAQGQTTPGQGTGREATQILSCPAGTFDVRADPAGGLLLGKPGIRTSACIIARDNEKTIEKCVTSLLGHVDEIIVLDTGSKDRTPEIARKLGARVFHWEWRDSFAAARNESNSHALGKWCFWMDTDDEFPGDKCGRILEQLARTTDPLIWGFIGDVHCPGAGEDGQDQVVVVQHVKMYRNYVAYAWERRLHEQILMPIRRAGGKVERSELYVIHSGYDHSPEGQERKKQRDFRLLHLELQDQPDDPFTLFNLGMTHEDVGELDKGIDYLRRSLDNSQPWESHVPKAYALLASCYLRSEQLERAFKACEHGLALVSDDVELRFRRATVLQALGQFEDSAKAYEEILRGRGKGWNGRCTSVDRGLADFKTRQNLAGVYGELGRWDKAEEQWRHIVSDKPEYRPAWRGLGEAMLKQSKIEAVEKQAGQLLTRPRLKGIGFYLLAQVMLARNNWPEARQYLLQCLEEPTVDIVLLDQSCRIFFERGTPQEAEQAMRQFVATYPENASARLNLATICNKSGRFEEAVRECRESLRLRPNFAGAMLTLGYALCGCNRVDEARAAWQEVLRLEPANMEARRCLESLQGRPGEAPRRGEASASPPALTARKMSFHVAGREVSLQLVTRGAVDEAIARDIWERDVYRLGDVSEPPETILDLGGHIGCLALLAAQRWPEARIITCEADPENAVLLRHHLSALPHAEVLEAAILGEDTAEADFWMVQDKVRMNSGGGSCCRNEIGSVRIRRPAMSITKLWRAKALARCPLLKIDCEGAEYGILGALGGAGLLTDVGLITGEWHCGFNGVGSPDDAERDLRCILEKTHQLEIQAKPNSCEGHFQARCLRKKTER